MRLNDTYDRICLLVSLTEKRLLVLWTGLPSRPRIISSGLMTFNVSSANIRNNRTKLLCDFRYDYNLKILARFLLLKCTLIRAQIGDMW